MNYYNLSEEEALKKLNTDKCGLSINEVEKRIKLDGFNKIEEGKKQSKFSKFINEFKDTMIIILIIAAIISFVVAVYNDESFMDSIIIIAIVILNALLGFIQELKADQAIESLKKMQVSKVKVKRNNQIFSVNSEEIVKGDILILEAGDTVPADARIIWEASLKVDEASLTGESIPVLKTTKLIEGEVPLSNRKNMIYSGTNIVYGKCNAVVCEVGMNTEFGIIAKSLNKEEKDITPLQKKIDGISKFLSMLIMFIIAIMFVIGLFRGMELIEVFMLSISLAVAAIPEGLPAVITITLSLGMSAMAKKNAIVRKMSSVETLGCTEIICSDKTGTITQNKMTVREIVYNNQIMQIKDLEKDNILFYNMVLNNDVEKNGNDYIGEPTEIALYESLDNYLNIIKVRKENKRINEIPFDSERKMMSTVNESKTGVRLYTKGSFDSVIKSCKYILENNEIKKLTPKKKNILKELEVCESNKAYRVLAFAYKDIEKKEKDIKEEDLIFIGLTAMIDPPRTDVKEAILACKKANIKPIMITGDSLSTAVAIAKEIGILESEEQAILGIELDKLSEEELKEAVKLYTVYARVSPTNKLAIVNAWKENNKIVAMTGDGVNDAPALKVANIGVGMGITGTEVSKGVSDIVLADDSFSTIVSAVKEGRRIYDNIRNVLVYLLTANIAEIIIVFIGMLFGAEVFLPIQLLYINLITDSLPAIALAFEKEEENIMERPVRKKDSSFFTPFILGKMSLSAIIKSGAILLIYFINLNIYNSGVAATTAFLTLIILEILYAYSCRNLKKTIFNRNIFNNKQMNLSVLGLLLVQIIVFVTPIRNIFGLVSLNYIQVIYTLIISLLVFLIDEVSKKMLRSILNDN